MPVFEFECVWVSEWVCVCVSVCVDASVLYTHKQTKTIEKNTITIYFSSFCIVFISICPHLNRFLHRLLLFSMNKNTNRNVVNFNWKNHLNYLLHLSLFYCELNRQRHSFQIKNLFSIATTLLQLLSHHPL